MTDPMVDEELNGFGASGATAVLPAERRPVALSPELVDLITEAVAMPATAAARAEVVHAMLLRALDAVSWRQEFVGDGTEEASLLGVLQAAEAHRQRMAVFPERLR